MIAVTLPRADQPRHRVMAGIRLGAGPAHRAGEGAVPGFAALVLAGDEFLIIDRLHLAPDAAGAAEIGHARFGRDAGAGEDHGARDCASRRASSSALLEGRHGAHHSARKRRCPIRRPTLPDLLRGGLDVVFVGINPSVYSPTLRALLRAQDQSLLARLLPLATQPRARAQALGVERLEPIHDRVLQDYGFGFTDLVKRAEPARDRSDARRAEDGVAALARKIKRYKPRFACFTALPSAGRCSACWRRNWRRLVWVCNLIVSARRASSSCPIQARPMRISCRRISRAGTMRSPMHYGYTLAEMHE